MSEQLEVRAELMRLARLLGREVHEFEYLAENVSSHELRELRGQVTAVLFDAQAHAFTRIAATTKLLPAALTASLGEKVFGPVLVARLAGLVDPDRAVDLASRFSTEFLADVAIELDPRRAGPVIARIPPARIAAIAAVLIGRREYVGMASFVDHLPDASIAAALEHADDESLLQVALMLENKERLPILVRHVGDSRLRGMFAVAARAGIVEESRALLPYLDDRQRAIALEAVDAGTDTEAEAGHGAAQSA